MRGTILISILTIFLFLALTPNGIAGAGKGLDNYILRHEQRIGNQPPVASKAHFYHKSTSSGNSMLFDDNRINDDAAMDRFVHQYSAAVLLDNGKTLVAWEDDRNGDFDIYGQVIAANGSPSGNNQLIISDDYFLSQKMLRFARSSEGTIAAVWVDENGDLWLSFYDSTFAQATDAALVNDNMTGNVVSYPDLTFLSDNSLIVVWEDTRLGSAIYGQLYNTSFAKIGANFKISPDESGRLYWTPGVAAGDNGQFAVAWEELGQSDSKVYILLFDSEGNPTGIPINVVDPGSQSEDQFGPDIGRLESQGYLVAWSDSRGDDQNIYGQVFDLNGNKIDDNFAVSEGTSNITSDLSFAESPAGGLLAAWSNISTRSEIVAQAFDDMGIMTGGNILVSDAMELEERFSPCAAFRNDGSMVVAFSDSRDGIVNIYAQNINPDYSLSGTNYKLSSAGVGARQSNSQVTRMTGGDFSLVWQDARNDEGDIYLQRCSESGIKIGSNQKVNDDAGASLQADPAIGSSENGQAVVAWVDSRSEGDLEGVNIFGQRYSANGQKNGDNFIVNDDSPGSLSTQSEPDCDIGEPGNAVVVWTDNRNGKNDIYCQLYDQSGLPEGGNFKVNQQDYECYNPAVSMIYSGEFVVAWNVIIESKSYIQFQIFDSDGSLSGDNTIIPVDTSLNQQYDFDLSTNPNFGIFVLAWINQDGTDSEIYSMIIGFDGIPMSSVKILSDFANLGFEDISVDMDAINSYGVVWSDMRSGIKRSYLGFVDQATVVTSNQLISRNPVNAREQEPAVAVSGRQAICAWSDNRNPGNGYDIYVNSQIYNPTSAEDDDDLALPSEFTLAQNYPNPFNPVTTIDYTISDDIHMATFEVLNILGQSVYREELPNLSPGSYSLEFNGDNLPSGIYLYRLTTDESKITRKMTLLK